MKTLNKLAIAAMICGASVSCENKVTYKVPAPEDVMMYQVNPRVFAPDHSFNAAALQLDSIKSLGANVVWLMPIYEVGKEKSVNSPYCIKDYKALNPEFGNMQEFNSFVDECHKRGMSVIIDWVANHTSWDNAWVLDHPDWYTQDSTGTIISPEGTGWLDVADLNFDNQDMRLAMIDAMKFWVNEAGVDGFRCDAADFVPFDFWKQAIDSLRSMPDHKLLLLAEGKRKDHFDAGFEMNYAWDFAETMREVFRKDTTAAKVFKTDMEEYDSIPEGCVKLRFTTNHDEATKMSPIDEFISTDGSMSAFTISAFLHGGALIYGSQEVGYPSTINFFNYVPVDWSMNPQLRQEYRQLMHLYNEHPALRKGQMTPYPAKDVVTFAKSLNGENFLIMASARRCDVLAEVPEGWKGAEVTDMISGEKRKLGDSEYLFGYKYYIFKK